jgi:hypothetical protein
LMGLQSFVSMKERSSRKLRVLCERNFPNGGDFGDALDNQRLRIS